jgi:hypothetical protein
MSEPAPLEEPVRDPANSRLATVPVRGFGAGHWSSIAVVALALLLWAPRFSGPIDLRWDAGVYYLLGTSLAAGEGYRIPSEPGSPEALQYPPLLPALVALHQWALGATDPVIVAPWLRRTYAALFVVYGLTTLALARVYLRPGLALAATTLCLLHAQTIFLSDLLFSEIPFALVSVGFALVAGGKASTTRLRETGAFVLAAAGFLLRTAGAALLATWVIEALARRRLRLALMRGLLAVLLIALWQSYVVRVRASDAYVRPAYEYQRAAYQNYNVPYAENILQVDPFRPELGRADGGALAARLVTNLARMPAALGEAVSAPKRYWQSALERTNRLLGRHLLPVGLVWVPILGFGALVLAGSVLFIRCHNWTLAGILLLSIALVCLTPWPEEFGRYLTPTAPFLTIAAILPLQRLDTALCARGSRRATLLGRLALAGLVVLLLAVQTFAAARLFLDRDREGASFIPGSGATGSRFFYFGRSWLAWEQAVAWIGARAAPSAIVATSVPHQFYLHTGLRAVYPSMDADPEQAHRLLETVPVSYVIVDELGPREFVRRYALPAVESHPTSWRVVHTINGTRIYEHTAAPQVKALP